MLVFGSNYLSLDQRASITYLLITKKIATQVNVLKSELIEKIDDKCDRPTQ